jgi:sulfate permease, SulP family
MALVSLYRASSRRLGREFGVVARPDFIAAIAALLGVTVFDPLPGPFIGIAVSPLLLIYRASRPYIATLGRTPGPDGHYRDVDRHPDARPPDHIAVLRVESSLYFANADAVAPGSCKPQPTSTPARSCSMPKPVPFIDVTSARMLADETDELHERGVQLFIAREVGQVRDIVRHVVADRGLTNLYPTVEAAVDAANRTTR